MAGKDTDVTYDKSLRPARLPGQLGDWASVLAIALFAALWLMWPRVPERPSGRAMPTAASCAYVELARTPYSPLHLHRIFQGDAASDDGIARLPSPPVPAIPDVPVIESFEHPYPGFAAREYGCDVSRFETGDDAFPYSAPSLSSTGITVVVSETLRNAGFEFDVPEDVRVAPGPFSAHLAFSPSGRCVSLLIDSSAEDAASVLPWRTALSFSHTVTNAVGTVVVR